MNKIDQTKFGKENGNCFSACVAMLLGMDLDDVPFFMGNEPAPWLSKGDMDVEDWFGKFNAWLKQRGWFAVMVTYHEDDGTWEFGPHILSGVSPRSTDDDIFHHSVVAIGDEVFHDPHPDRSELRTCDDRIFLVPLEPWKCL